VLTEFERQLTAAATDDQRQRERRGGRQQAPLLFCTKQLRGRRLLRDRRRPLAPPRVGRSIFVMVIIDVVFVVIGLTRGGRVQSCNLEPRRYQLRFPSRGEVWRCKEARGATNGMHVTARAWAGREPVPGARAGPGRGDRPRRAAPAPGAAPGAWPTPSVPVHGWVSANTRARKGRRPTSACPRLGRKRVQRIELGTRLKPTDARSAGQCRVALRPRVARARA
jgi:hypothetical protein